MSEYQSAPARQDLEKLKSDWARDPCWDIEDTEGFEGFRKVRFLQLQAGSPDSQEANRD